MAVLADLVERFDLAVDQRLESLRKHHLADRVFYSASAFGDFGLIWVVYSLIRALRGGKTNERAAVRGIVATGVESFLVNIVMKSFFERRRPIRELDHPLPIRQPLSSSFPSGHATAAFCGATLLAERDRLGPLYFLSAVVIAISRVYVRIHHASDVVGGVIVGLLLGQIGKRLFPLDARHH